MKNYLQEDARTHTHNDTPCPKTKKPQQDGRRDAITIKSNSLLAEWATHKLENNNAKDILKNRVEYFADLMQVNYSKIIIMNNKRRWGACTNKAILKFNYRLCMLPHKIIDYIIIHEFAHLIEFNHSHRFYRIIESVMPDYKRYKNELKKYDYLLALFR